LNQNIRAVRKLTGEELPLFGKEGRGEIFSTICLLSNGLVIMFDIEISEVYSLNQEVPEHGETPKKHGRNS
jgi:hypothetical protein